MEIIHLNLCFKGSRNYLHGSDMYNAVSKEVIEKFNLRSIAKVKFTIHRFAFKQCDLIVYEDNYQKPNDFIAEIFVFSPEKNIRGYIIETNKPVGCRYSFDEKSIHEICELQENRIKIIGKTIYTPIEVIVSMTKKLHYELYPIENGRWIFTGIEINHPDKMKDTDNLSVRLKHNFQHKLTKSDMLIKDSVIGNIFFSKV